MPSLKKNLIYNIAYQVLVIVIPLITAPYISRVLGVDGIGTYSYIYSIAYYFALCGMLGISNQGSRCIALAKQDRDKTSQEFANLYCIQFVTTVIALVLYIIFVILIFDGNKTIAYIDVIFILSYVLDINWLFFGMEQFKITVSRNVIIKILTVFCVFCFVRTKIDLWLYTLIMAMGSLLSQLYLWANIKKIIDFKKPVIKKIKIHLRSVLILFIPVAAYSIYKVMDKIMLGAFTNVIQVGYYENADKIVNLPVGFITAFGTVMLPRISSLSSEGNCKQIKKYNKMTFKYFSILVFGAVFGLSGISDVLAPVYFGEEFWQCAPIIKGLSFTLIFMTWANIIRTQYLIPNKRDMPYVISTICGAVLNLIFNVITIPRYGAVGALIGTLLAEASVFIVQFVLVRKEFPVYRFIAQTIPFFIIGIIMECLVNLIGDKNGTSVTTLVLQVVLGFGFYAIGSCVYLYYSHDEILIGILRRKEKR